MSIAEKLKTIAENEQRVFDAGYTKGYDAGIAEGGSGGYAKFMDAYQQNGQKTDYRYAFARWSKEVFIPEHNISNVKLSDYMFYYFNSDGDEALDLVEHLAKLGLNTGFSNISSSAASMFENAKISRIGEINISSRNVHYAFGSSYIKTIDKVTFGASSFIGGSYTFRGCTALENITIGGTINASGLDFQACSLLTHDSLMSIINALKDYSGSTTTYTLTLGSTNLAKLTDAEKAIATQKGWTLA